MNRFSDEQNEALLLSIEHWLENFQTVERMAQQAKKQGIPDTVHSMNFDEFPIYSDSCECCKKFLTPFKEDLDEPRCLKCPIAQTTGFNMCKNTPWAEVSQAIRPVVRGRFQEVYLEKALEAVEQEYRFLVCVWLGEAG